MEEQEWKEWMEEGTKPVTSQPGRALAAVQVEKLVAWMRAVIVR